MRKIKIGPNEEIRTELVRLYLEQDQPTILEQLQKEVREVTNHIIQGRQDVKNAVIAYCTRHNLVAPSPDFPEKPLFAKPKNSDENKLIAAAWSRYNKDRKVALVQYGKWLGTCFEAVKDIPECAWREDSYQTLRKIYGKIGPSVYRDTVQRVMRSKRAKPKKVGDHIPLEFCNTPIAETGKFYGNRRGIPFYNVLIKVSMPVGVGRLEIKGRLRRPLPGKPIQGVSIFKRVDGWYATVRCVVPKRLLLSGNKPAIGVDVGQTDLVAMSDGYKKHNPRDAEFVSARAAIQRRADLAKDESTKRIYWNKAGRLSQKRKRNITHWINSDLLPRLERHSTIFVEKLAKNFKSDRGPLSSMHTILSFIKERLGNRVVEVNPAYTSQTCSCCGNSTEIVREGKYFSCLNPDCMATLDADINAARNILAKGLQLLEGLGLECGVQPAETATPGLCSLNKDLCTAIGSRIEEVCL